MRSQGCQLKIRASLDSTSSWEQAAPPWEKQMRPANLSSSSPAYGKDSIFIGMSNSSEKRYSFVPIIEIEKLCLA